METRILSEIKQLVLSLDVEEGVSKDTYNKVLLTVKETLGPDAMLILADSTEVGPADEIFFPNSGDCLKTWKRMLHAYREEKALDKAHA
jgi:hypothetical protein